MKLSYKFRDVVRLMFICKMIFMINYIKIMYIKINTIDGTIKNQVSKNIEMITLILYISITHADEFFKKILLGLFLIIITTYLSLIEYFTPLYVISATDVLIIHTSDQGKLDNL